MRTVKQTADVLGVASNTIRQWTKDFPEFLSPSAVPGQGKTRKFTDDDIRLFWTIKVLRAQRIEPNELIVRLQSGERIEPIEANEQSQGPTEPLQEDEGDYTPPPSFALQIVENLTNERDYLRQELTEERTARLSAENRATAAETELRVVKDLQEQEKAQGEESERQHVEPQSRPSWWDRLRGK